MDQYCREHSTPLHPVLEKLMLESSSLPQGRMVADEEVLATNAMIIRCLGAKKVLDIGVFTGASSLSAALSLPDDGKVVACDTSSEWTDRAMDYWEKAGVTQKVDLHIAPAANTLESLIKNGQQNTFDFAFIDADKQNYDTYYELCLQLIKKGGVIALDNTCWKGKVLEDTNDE